MSCGFIGWKKKGKERKKDSQEHSEWKGLQTHTVYSSFKCFEQTLAIRSGRGTVNSDKGTLLVMHFKTRQGKKKKKKEKKEKKGKKRKEEK